MKKKVGIVVVTYNRLELLKECIDSLRLQSFVDYDIIIVNNGSTDGTNEWLTEQKDIISINQSNLGGAGGFYSGLKFVAETNYEYCWFMDDDTISTLDSLKHLFIAASKLNDFGFLCSNVYYPNNKPCNIPGIDLSYSINGEQIWTEKAEYNLIRVRSSSFVSVFIKTIKIKEFGLPYKDFFIWGDDTEYTLRISKIYPSYLVLDSKVIHKRAEQKALSLYSETNPIRIRNFFFFYRNRLYVSFKMFSYKTFYWIFITFMEMINLFIRCRFYKSFIILKSLVALLFFHPKIEYPGK